MSEKSKVDLDKLIQSARKNNDLRIELSGLSVDELKSLRNSLDLKIQETMGEFHTRIQAKNQKEMDEQPDNTFETDRKRFESEMGILAIVRDAVENVLASVSFR